MVRLCARLTGDLDAAEDLAQETLFEAWRHGHKLRDRERRAPWLNGIARNVCLRWLRERGRESALLARSGVDDVAPGTGALERAADGFDLEVELERHELAELLDRALALLPPHSREALVERYVRDSPHAEIAARLGVSEGTVKMRLQRGRLALRRVLATDLIREAAPYGVSGAEPGAWQETRLWCHRCGQRRLLGCFRRQSTPGGDAFTLRCPDCNAEPDDTLTNVAEPGAVLEGVRGYKPALTRIMRWSDEFYRRALVTRTAPCWRCGRPCPLRMRPSPSAPPSLRRERGMHVRCPACGANEEIALRHLALYLPEGQRFWREHPRIRTLPERAVEIDGRAALLLRFQSVSETAELAVVVARATYAVLGVHGDAPGADD